MSSSRRMLGVDTAAATELKTSWPEVVGMGLFLAAEKIYSDRPDVHIEVHRVGERVDPVYDPERVRVFINSDATLSVALTPVVG